MLVKIIHWFYLDRLVVATPIRALNQSTVDGGFTRENSPINKEKYSVSFH